MHIHTSPETHSGRGGTTRIVAVVEVVWLSQDSLTERKPLQDGLNSEFYLS